MSYTQINHLVLATNQFHQSLNVCHYTTKQRFTTVIHHSWESQLRPERTEEFQKDLKIPSKGNRTLLEINVEQCIFDRII